MTIGRMLAAAGHTFWRAPGNAPKRNGSNAMCPACIAAATVWIVSGAVTGGGSGALITKVLRSRKFYPHISQKKGNVGHENTEMWTAQNNSEFERIIWLLSRGE